MQSPQLHDTQPVPPFVPRPAFVVHHGPTQRPAMSPQPNDSSPLHSVRALAGAVFVVSAAAGWIAVAVTVSAPLVAAGELLSRAGKTIERRA